MCLADRLRRTCERHEVAHVLRHKRTAVGPGGSPHLGVRKADEVRPLRDRDGVMPALAGQPGLRIIDSPEDNHPKSNRGKEGADVPSADPKRGMNLPGTLAALLLGGPSHGYELFTTLESELGPLWVTRASQIYLTLGRMERDGLVRSRRIRQASRPDRRLLTLTRSGQELAERWLWTQDSGEEIVVRLMVARLVIPDRLPALAEAIERELMAVLHRLRTAKAETEAGFGREALDHEVRRTEADLRWVSSIRERVAEIVARPRARRAPGASARLA